MEGPTVTIKEYKGFQYAFDWFNKTLFDNTLPQVLITLQRRPKSYGYFSPNRFSGRGENAAKVHELALNPAEFAKRIDEEILSTLAHEMAHLWQQSYGKMPSKAYHDRYWAAKMESIGLMPSDTGRKGGKKTGQHMSHY